MKIAVYAIAKNEEQFVKRFCDSAKEADLILIADTGSTDNTAVLAAECGAVVYDIFVKPWRFDTARDAALALIPKDYDVCVSLDLDEILTDGWRQEIENVWKADTTRLRYKYDWGSGISFYYEKIHHRHGYYWKNAVHEYPMPRYGTIENYAQTDKLLVVHMPDNSKSRGQYLPLLEQSVKEDKHEPRNAFYYARELTFYSRWLDAVVALNDYLNMPEATWQNERAYAMRLLGKCYDELKQDGRLWYIKACETAPNTREVWVELAQSCYFKSDWQTCFDACKKALLIKDKELVYTMNPEVWGALPHDLLAIAAYNLGNKEEAITNGKLALQFEPDNTRLTKNLTYYLE
jgi:tetratricopeptide (TPR) repeat protein